MRRDRRTSTKGYSLWSGLVLDPAGFRTLLKEQVNIGYKCSHWGCGRRAWLQKEMIGELKWSVVLQWLSESPTIILHQPAIHHRLQPAFDERQ